MKALSYIRSNPYIFIFLFFGVVFGLVSLVNHYNFRTYGFDLGIFNNSIWDYAHFRWNSNTILQPAFDNILSDHFTLLTVLISPLYWLFGSYTLLIVQILALLWGGFGIYKFVLLKCNNQFIASLAAIQFLSFWGIYTALAFEYHDNVLAAAFIPFFFYFLEIGDWRKTILYFSLILISKENMALWMVFVCIGAAWLYVGDFAKCKRLIVLAIISGLYMIIVIKYVIPSLGNADRSYLHFHYAALGQNMKEAFFFVINNLYDTFLLLFNDPSNSGGGVYKKQLHLAVFFSGGIFMFWRPQYLVMLIPIYAQKLFSDDMGKWGVSYHYCVEYAPILVLVTYDVIQNISSKKITIAIAICTIISTGYVTYNVLENEAIWWQDKNNLQFYSAAHYHNNEVNVQELQKVIDLIPDDAPLSAQSSIVSHVAFRDKIYQYPVINDAAYIILVPSQQATYPLSKEDYTKSVEDLLKSNDWKIEFQSKNTLLMKRAN